MDIFGVHHKTGLVLGVISMQVSFLRIFGSFLKIKVQNMNIFGGCSNSNDIPDISFFCGGGGGVNSRCWVQAYVSRKEMRVHVPPLDMYTTWSHDKRVFTIWWP